MYHDVLINNTIMFWANLVLIIVICYLLHSGNQAEADRDSQEKQQSPVSGNQDYKLISLHVYLNDKQFAMNKQAK